MHLHAFTQMHEAAQVDDSKQKVCIPSRCAHPQRDDGRQLSLHPRTTVINVTYIVHLPAKAATPLAWRRVTRCCWTIVGDFLNDFCWVYLLLLLHKSLTSICRYLVSWVEL